MYVCVFFFFQFTFYPNIIPFYSQYPLTQILSPFPPFSKKGESPPGITLTPCVFFFFSETGCDSSHFNPSIQKGEAGGSQRLRLAWAIYSVSQASQSYMVTLSQKQNKNKLGEWVVLVSSCWSTHLLELLRGLGGKCAFLRPCQNVRSPFG